jgi:tetratricopeptide (TPR) repeat protein
MRYVRFGLILAATTATTSHFALDQRRAESVDRLFTDKRYSDVLDVLKGNAADADALWRSARAHRFMAADQSRTLEQRKQSAEECLRLATKAVEVDEHNWAAHKWLGIALSVVGDFRSTTEQLKNAFVIRREFERALELQRDATTAHLIGKWCSYFASMGWATRNVASLLFATPPSSTLEEALKYYLLAEEIEPGFYKSNAWAIAQTYKQMGNLKEYRQWRMQVLRMPSMDLDDEKADREAHANDI